MTDLVWLLVFRACRATVLARLVVLELIMAVEPAECCPSYCVLQTLQTPHYTVCSVSLLACTITIKTLTGTVADQQNSGKLSQASLT